MRNGHLYWPVDHCRREEKNASTDRGTTAVNTGPQTWQKVSWELFGGVIKVVCEGAGFPCIVFEIFKGGILYQILPPTPHCLGGIGSQPPFVYLPSPAFPLAAQLLLFTAFCMKVAICEDYPVWGLKKKEDTVAWVLILTQGRTADMGSVSNQEFPGWVTK